jgi:hypothetical protein
MLNGPDNPFHEDSMGPPMMHNSLLNMWLSGAHASSKPRESQDKVVRMAQVLNGPHCAMGDAPPEP